MTKFDNRLLQARAGVARHETSVEQSHRRVPINLRQSGPTPVEMLISTRGKEITVLAPVGRGWLLAGNGL